VPVPATGTRRATGRGSNPSAPEPAAHAIPAVARDGRLDGTALRLAARELAARDPRLGRLLRAHGTPPLWARPPGLASLVRIILEQQVSLGSARAAFERLRAATGGRITPRAFLRLDDAALRAAGFSRQKSGYARDLARAIVDGTLDLGALAALPDDEARRVLMAQRGIGRWSADIYLLMALRRPDVWPTGDLALLAAMETALELPQRPGDEDALRLAEAWRPWRAVAARMLWTAYLASRGRPLR
jgi:DNA-3-methyladenine glycosylase II